MSNNSFRPWQSPRVMAEKKKIAAREHAPDWNSIEKDKKTLTTLPPEVRNIIYVYALCKEKKITIRKAPPRGISGNAKLISPNLLRTCKLIHQEARPIFYSGNHFIIPSLYLRKFLSVIDFSTEHLASLTFELNELEQSDDQDRCWRAGFHQLALLIGLRELKVRMYVCADQLNVQRMVKQLSPVVANMRRARSKDARAWTAESLAKALTFSMDVKRSGRGSIRNPNAAERRALEQTFPREVMAGLEEIHVAPK